MEPLFPAYNQPMLRNRIAAKALLDQAYYELTQAAGTANVNKKRQ
jgi:hypothetical protein